MQDDRDKVAFDQTEDVDKTYMIGGQLGGGVMRNALS